MEPIRVKADLYWVGAIDWAVRDFHGYHIKNGTTYNNYLLIDDEVTIFDTVHKEFSWESLQNIRNIVELSSVKNLVVNHIEPDHIGSFEDFLREMPNLRIFATERGKKGMVKMFGIDPQRIKTVKTGERISTGKYSLVFIETPMLHWPDSMMTYIPELKTLISQDAFGFHFASSVRFDDEFIEAYSEEQMEDAVWDYYANILLPFGNLILSKIEEIKKMNLEIEIIAPDHGIIWRKDPKRVLNAYVDMAKGKASLGVIIVYDTMWHATEKILFPIVRGIMDEGLIVKVLKLRSSPTSDAVKEFLKLRGCLVGSPTLNNSMFPTLEEFLHYLSGLKPKLRIVGAFGSYGWSKGAVSEAYEIFKNMKLKTFEPGLEVNFTPTQEEIKSSYEFGRNFAKAVKEYHESLENAG